MRWAVAVGTASAKSLGTVVRLPLSVAPALAVRGVLKAGAVADAVAGMSSSMDAATAVVEGSFD